MMAAKQEITPQDILDLEAYNAIRPERRKEITELKKHRRLAVGPHATFYFECYETMWYQVQEMLRIEKGGEEQLADELEAYNPLIPKGNELVATVMFEIEDAVQRARILDGLGGVENTMVLDVDGDRIQGDPEEDVDRTSAAGKASSVQFVHFRLTPDQIAKFKQPGIRVTVSIEHSNYGHIAIVPEETRAALAKDFAD